MEDTQILCEYVNLQTRIRSAATAVVSILAGVTEMDVVACVKAMQSICEGKELQGLKADLIANVKIIKLLRQLEEVVEGIAGRQDEG